MNRITNKMLNNTMSHNLQRHQREMDKIQESLATGKKVRFPRDNPISSTNQMMYQSRIVEIDQYISNLNESKSRLDHIDSSLQSTLKIFQRLRVLTVQGANGIYSSFELKEAAATEINQLLNELVNIANTKSATGRAIFGGFNTGTEKLQNPFVPVYHTMVKGNQGDVIVDVQYRGNIGKLKREISQGEYLDVNIPGNRVFWATNEVLTSNESRPNYTSPTDQVIKIDGREIKISAGDNIDIIIDKINKSDLQVKARLGGSNNLILETTTPHQIWMEDVGSGTVLQDLGMINRNASEPPNNVNPTVVRNGFNVFEMVIELRKHMVKGDQALIGGRDLGLIDQALENILRNLAEVGARQNRVDEVIRRSEIDKANFTELFAKSEGIDFAESIMNFKWIESVHQYALAVGAKTIKPTLMDFLR